MSRRTCSLVDRRSCSVLRFLKEFSRRPPISSAEQIRIINDFLDFIAGKMRSFDPWKVSLMENEGERGEAEFDMALEAMEKLVMNRLWHLSASRTFSGSIRTHSRLCRTFTPAIDLSTLPQNVSPTDDLERDHVLGQRIRLFAWIQPCHLDLPLPEDLAASNAFLPPTELLGAIDLDEPPLSPGAALRQQKDEAEAKQKLKQTRGFLDFAQKELNKINQYKAPRDKLICVLNSCKVIFGRSVVSAPSERELTDLYRINSTYFERRRSGCIYSLVDLRRTQGQS